MPRGLGTAGQRLWRTTLDEFEMDSEPHKIEILTQACKVTDKIAELEKAQKGQPLTVLGSARQLTIHPLVAEVRFQRGLLAQLLGKLGLPDTDEALEAKAEKLSETRRRSAKSPTFRVVQ
ncbi:hypothetical protein JWS13_10055 [Rhodococcus pseudokoreensis]|uniref:Phage terminase, small subunit, putative, P27 family n=1 Tax=Rhodococcus pseudokoreensis TaxID=2811421 RepID=A0A974W1E9_9NOCA|nr:hypothetical protein [Rhodococcus pseudokoreensis]QSE88925.1 hypothetical protein JWS13_10055 [Rhodococcus pseudokoreensis]